MRGLHWLLWNHPGHRWEWVRWVDRQGRLQGWSWQVANWYCNTTRYDERHR